MKFKIKMKDMSLTRKFSAVRLSAVAASILILAGCREEFVEESYSIPEILEFGCSAGDEVTAGNEITWSASFRDEATSIVRMNLDLVCRDEIINSVSMKLQGRDYAFPGETIYVPFVPDFDEDSEAVLVCSVMNRTGQECRDTLSFLIRRPEIPAVLYLHYDGGTIAMNRSETNPYEFVSSGAEFTGTFTGRISTSRDLESSEIVWGASSSSGIAGVLENGEGNGFSMDFGNAYVTEIYFNSLTFAVSSNVVDGVFMNGVRLSEDASLANGDNSVYAARINLVQGQEVTVNGIDDIEQAYNRDFFSYDPETGKLIFLRESGEWDVIWSAAYNYIWMFRMDDAAPSCYWLVGHGFTSAFSWNNDYNTGGWSYDYLRTGYMVRTDDNLYQATIYLSTSHEWGGFEVEIYSDRSWNKTYGALLHEGDILGDNAGFAISASNGFANTSDGTFVPGYYRVILDTSAGTGSETLTVEKL